MVIHSIIPCSVNNVTNLTWHFVVFQYKFCIIKNDNSENEADKVLNAIEKLGEPEKFLRPIIADRLISDTLKTLNSKNILLGIGFNFYSNMKRAFVSFIFSFGYLACMVFALMAVLKVFFPDHIGLIKQNPGVLS